MFKTTVAAAAIAAITAFAAAPQAEARSLSPRENAAQSETLVIQAGHRVDRHNAGRRDDHRHARPHHRRLHRGQVVRRLAWQGYYGFSKVRDRGAVFTVKAFSPRGRQVRLRVDARSGQIIHRRPVGPGFRGKSWNTGGRGQYSR